MKKLILFILFLIPFTILSQKEVKKDTTQICLPTEIKRQIVSDLNELDKLRDLKKLTDFEVSELEKKVLKQDSIISKLEQKDVNNQIIVFRVEEKYKLVENDNKDLRQKLKWAGIKSNIIEIFSGALMASFVYIQLFK